jgi:restriction system protein
MSQEEPRIWGIHTKDDRLFLDDNVVAIGWKEMGNLLGIDASREAFKDKYAAVYPDGKKGSVPLGSGMLYRFCHEVQIGDYIVFPSKVDRQINIGIITSKYFHNSSAKEYVQQRKVKWQKHLPRTAFSQGALYELGSAMSFFSLKNYGEEFLAALDKGFKKKANEPDDTVSATSDDIVESTRDFVLKEISRHLKGYDLEEFVANLLNAMGYKTTISPHGGDRGVDITAYKDELPPRIIVQVKSQDDDIKETTIQSLKGAMREGDYGLFVTLSNYTKNAKRYLESTPIIRGINGTELVDLVLKYYDALDEKYQNIIPLQRVYIPAVKKD